MIFRFLKRFKRERNRAWTRADERTAMRALIQKLHKEIDDDIIRTLNKEAPVYSGASTTKPGS